MFARRKSTAQIASFMYKTLRIVLTLALAAMVLPACSRKQNPTPTDTVMGSGSRGVNDTGLIPGFASNEGDYGPGLTPRDPNATLGANGMFGDKQMIPGLLPSVYFGFDSSAISASERSKLQQAADYLMDNPSDDILIQGFCDWHGTAEYNLALGDRRAGSAKDYLITLGVSSDRIETLSKGSLEAVSGLSKAEAAEDRRAELIILQ